MMRYQHRNPLEVSLGRSPVSVVKRQREQAKRERQQIKAEKKAQRNKDKAEGRGEDEFAEPVREQEILPN